MKKKLLLSVILFISLFVSVLSFTSTSKAIDISDPDLYWVLLIKQLDICRFWCPDWTYQSPGCRSGGIS